MENDIELAGYRIPQGVRILYMRKFHTMSFFTHSQTMSVHLGIIIRQYVCELSHFRILKNYLENFNQTWHKYPEVKEIQVF